MKMPGVLQPLLPPRARTTLDRLGRIALATARRGMEAAFATVERHCPTELSAYVDCVDANPGSWHATCNELKQSLSACAAKQ